VEDEKTSPSLSAKDVNKLQQLTGTLLYYARAVDPTLIMPINVLASEQSRATSVTADKVIKNFNYCNTHPETKIRHHASDMILHIHSDVSYLSGKEAKSRAGGFFYMGSRNNTVNRLTNGAILIISKILKHVMSSAAEQKLEQFYICQRRSSPSQNITRTRAHAAPHTNVKIQYHCHMIQQWHNKTKNAQNQWTCIFIGKKIESNRGNLMCTGDRATKTWRTISQDTIRRSITK
jgi:hypothetical protein